MGGFYSAWTKMASSSGRSLQANFDGSAKVNLATTGIGGIIRDSTPTCILSFSDPVSFCLVNKVELSAESRASNLHYIK